MNYQYSCQENRGELKLSLVDPETKNEIWHQCYPVFTEDVITGELVEDLTLVETGIMKSTYDTAGLEKYLKDCGVISSADTITLNPLSVKLPAIPGAAMKLPEGVVLEKGGRSSQKPEIEMEGNCYVLVQNNDFNPILFYKDDIILYPERHKTFLQTVAYIPYVKSVITENPYIICCYDREKVWVFEEGEWVNPDFQTYGCSVNIIIGRTLGYHSSISLVPMSGISGIDKFKKERNFAEGGITNSFATGGKSLDNTDVFEKGGKHHRLIKNQVVSKVTNMHNVIGMNSGA